MKIDKKKLFFQLSPGSQSSPLHCWGLCS